MLWLEARFYALKFMHLFIRWLRWLDVRGLDIVACVHPA